MGWRSAMDDNTMDEAEVKPDDGAKPEDELGDAGKRALKAEREARKAAEKRAADAEALIKAAEDAEKSEVERLQGQVNDLTRQAGAATARADRFEVAAAKGLSIAQARRLVGSTREELEADADEMRSELGLDREPARRAPREDLKSGASNEDDAPDYAALAEKNLRRW